MPQAAAVVVVDTPRETVQAPVVVPAIQMMQQS
jgi:hypothetical protein